MERCGRRGVCAVWRSPAFGSYITLIQQEDTAQHSAMQSRQQTGRGENNVLRLHPLNLIETHSAEATFTHPPHAHFMNPLNLTFIFSLKNNKQPQGLFITGRGDCFCELLRVAVQHRCSLPLLKATQLKLVWFTE